MYTYYPTNKSEYRVKTLELANESQNLQMKILQQKRIEEAYKKGLLLIMILIVLMILGAICSPMLNQ